MADDQVVKRGLVIMIIFAIFILAFMVLKDILLPIIIGLLFAYIFGPVYKWLRKYLKNQSLSAFILILGIVVLVAIPIVYLAPTIVNETFDTYVYLQNYNFQELFSKYIEGDLASTLAINLDNFLGKIFTSFLSQFTNLLINLPSILLQFAVFLFTFFFAVRDSEKLTDYLSSLSPFSQDTEKRFLKEFRGITNAIIFGQVIIGIVQGLAVGAGLFFLGIPKALVLTVVASLVSIIPVLGSWIVWLPVGLSQIMIGNVFEGVFMLLYGSIIVSSIDNLLRPYMLSKQSNLPIALSVIGTIGGLYFYGIAGLVLGPLILAYVLIIIEFYRQGKLNELFKKHKGS